MLPVSSSDRQNSFYIFSLRLRSSRILSHTDLYHLGRHRARIPHQELLKLWRFSPTFHKASLTEKTLYANKKFLLVFILMKKVIKSILDFFENKQKKSWQSYCCFQPSRTFLLLLLSSLLSLSAISSKYQFHLRCKGKLNCKQRFADGRCQIFSRAISEYF